MERGVVIIGVSTGIGSSIAALEAALGSKQECVIATGDKHEVTEADIENISKSIGDIRSPEPLKIEPHSFADDFCYAPPIPKQTHKRPNKFHR
ncbi:MAG: hypothetical protein N4A71_05710 [Carboxylicivirga sp.]|jgi:CTP:molybdopterin cytidylyltransferase MocA|nr:hypothetical protein [Carboxylicivirga sp.]